MADGPSTPPPQTYGSDEAFRRIAAGLERQGSTRAVAEQAARAALLEAPFIDPTPDGWALVCRQARERAQELTTTPSAIRDAS